MKGKPFILVPSCIHALKTISNVYIATWPSLKPLNEMTVKSTETRAITFGSCDPKVISAFWALVADASLTTHPITQTSPAIQPNYTTFVQKRKSCIYHLFEFSIAVLL